MPETPEEIYDRNFHWRMIGAVISIALFLVAVVIVTCLSSALTANAIEFLFSMFVILTCVVILPLLQRPSKEKRKFSMDNPFISIPCGIFIGIISGVLLKLIFPGN